MTSRQLKNGYFALEGINSFAVSFYISYLFYFMRSEFGFGNLGNLTLGAVSGLIYIPGAFFGGRFAQRRGYFHALKAGWGLTTVALLAGIFLPFVPAQVMVLIVWSAGAACTWPALEALVVEGEAPADLPCYVGRYNIVWAGTSAVGYFVGGTLIEMLGWKSLFWLPALLHLAQLAAVFRLEKEARRQPYSPAPAPMEVPAVHEPDGVSRPVARQFLRMAWLANPFAYIAMNTAIPLLPEIATRLQLSTAQAGFFCSLWQFARLGTFAILWKWTGWHYRFGWLLSAFLLLIASFILLLVLPHPGVLVVTQLVLGWAVGLIYYSSLFYSMDASDAKGEHGGLHEAAIGIGLCSGPAIGALALRLAPQQANASAWAVGGVLTLGLLALLTLRPRRKQSNQANLNA